MSDKPLSALPRIIAVDSSCIMHRAHNIATHHNGILSASYGVQTHVVFAFVRAMWSLQDFFGQDAHMIAVFDAGRSKKRTEIYPDYKAGRKPKDPELLSQMRECYRFCAPLGISPMAVSGEEADDLLYTVCQKSPKDHHVYLVTEDKDMCQCITERVSVVRKNRNGSHSWEVVEEAECIADFGCKPSQIADYLAIVGDSSDNIRGVRGVGPKTAAAWLEKYGDAQSILDSVSSLTPERFRKVVEDAAPIIHRNLQLTRLMEIDAPFPERSKPDYTLAAQKMEDLEMRALLSRLSSRIPGPMHKEVQIPVAQSPGLQQGLLF